jgi:hypothetical protein
VRVKQFNIRELRAGTPAAASSACSRLNAPITSFGGALAIAACISATRSVITDSAVISEPLRLL